MRGREITMAFGRKLVHVKLRINVSSQSDYYTRIEVQNRNGRIDICEIFIPGWAQVGNYRPLPAWLVCNVSACLILRWDDVELYEHDRDGKERISNLCYTHPDEFRAELEQVKEWKG
jgi:hypothetical protein